MASDDSITPMKSSRKVRRRHFFGTGVRRKQEIDEDDQLCVQPREKPLVARRGASRKRRKAKQPDTRRCVQCRGDLSVARFGASRPDRACGWRSRRCCGRAASPPHAHELRRMHRQGVADVVQAQRVRRVVVDQRLHMTGRGEPACVDLVRARQHGNRMARNQIAHLPKHGMLTSRWPGRSTLAGARRATALQVGCVHACSLQAHGLPVSVLPIWARAYGMLLNRMQSSRRVTFEWVSRTCVSLQPL